MLRGKGEYTQFSFIRLEIELIDYPLEMVFRLLKIRAVWSKEYRCRTEYYLPRVDN